MEPKPSEETVDRLRKDLELAQSTEALAKVTRRIIDVNSTSKRSEKLPEYTSLKGLNDVPYFSRSSKSGDKEVLIVGRTVDPWREESVTLVFEEGEKESLDGLSYFMGGKRINIVKDEQGRDDSLEVEPSEPVTGEAALPKAKEIIAGMII